MNVIKVTVEDGDIGVEIRKECTGWAYHRGEVIPGITVHQAEELIVALKQVIAHVTAAFAPIIIWR